MPRSYRHLTLPDRILIETQSGVESAACGDRCQPDVGAFDRYREIRRNKAILDMVLVEQRPVEIKMRLVPGHWEGDLMPHRKLSSPEAAKSHATRTNQTRYFLTEVGRLVPPDSL